MSFASSDFTPRPDHWYIVLLIPSCLHRLKSIFVPLSGPTRILYVTGPSSLLGLNIMLLSWFISQHLPSAFFSLVLPQVHFPLRIPFTVPWAQSSRQVSRAVCTPIEVHANPFVVVDGMRKKTLAWKSQSQHVKMSLNFYFFT